MKPIIKLTGPLILAGVNLMQYPLVCANESLFLDKMINDEDISVTLDVWYGDGEPDESQPLFLDIYEPSSALLPSRLPALVYIHGGAFTLGDKADQAAPLYSNEFARRGYVVFSINYTLDGTVNSASLDAATAIRWVKANANTFKVDPDRIIVGGHSAGGATSLNIGALEAEDLGGAGAEVADVLNSAGADFVDLDKLDINDPPMFIINGTEDTLSPVENARNLVARLDSLADLAGGISYPYSYMEVQGAGHSFILGNGLGFPPPVFAGSPQDEFQGWSNTEVDGQTVERHCFEFFYQHLTLAELTTSSSWAGYEVNEFGWANTGT